MYSRKDKSMSRIDFGSKVYFIEPFDKCFVSAGDSGVIINLYNESYVLILDKNDKSIRVKKSMVVRENDYNQGSSK